ncbi:short chain dehydrogenase [Tritonibacter multivorans]|uniref:Short chain dehydrogenase n=1 Tax=Tritonibacter multivorans TaxID=928856 RepID=A0A0P1GCJ3_9RHOB|nr:NAD-dependent epimerase/dehydratase family protein [Tritonibacter multivorans]MDA7419267.1 NAD-dependent epimerase/dehydratase family protein [Tritonibacter multivorans]CUH79174.1 short chain dehydrogenase [Tritonibacter multivorans]SFD24022.1 dihydroflavonol-4-reductase [Tritonibacter multivorans]
MTLDTSRPALVTGATGYVAGWLIKELLEAGVTVHACVRNPDNTAKQQHLIDAAAAAPGEIKFFKADLLDEGSFDAAMAGCGVVFHTASPFTVAVDDAQRDLVDPAVKGTRNVLNAANRTESVSRVVVTSSCAAIYGDNADVAEAPGGRLDESVWNTSSTLEHNAYSFSKTEAEKAAWEIAGGQDRWDLVCVNPALVVGPALQDRPTSESFNLVRQMGDGTMKSGAPKWYFGIVDVRDLAKAHVAAGYKAEANGRNIVFGHESSIFDLSQLLRAKYGADYPLPKSAAPKWLVWLLGPIMDKSMTRKLISRNIGVEWKADNSKGKRELGVTYRPLKDSMEDMFQQMIDAGQFAK